MLEIRHQLPGRLRLRVPAIATEPGRAAAIAALLRAQTGVHRVRINPACASLLIEFAPALQDAAAITARVRALAGQPVTLPTPATMTNRPTKGQQRGLQHGLLAPAGRWWQRWGRRSQVAGTPGSAAPAQPTRTTSSLAMGSMAPGLLSLNFSALRAPVGWRPIDRLRVASPVRIPPARASRTPPPDGRRPSILTLLHARAARWLVRSTMRCWWEEFHANRISPACQAPQRVRTTRRVPSAGLAGLLSS